MFISSRGMILPDHSQNANISSLESTWNIPDMSQAHLIASPYFNSVLYLESKSLFSSYSFVLCAFIPLTPLLPFYLICFIF